MQKKYKICKNLPKISKSTTNAKNQKVPKL